MTATDSRRLMSTAEAAEYLGDLRDQLLVQWRYEAKGPAFHRVGRQIRYDVDDLDRWLEDQRVTPGV